MTWVTPASCWSSAHAATSAIVVASESHGVPSAAGDDVAHALTIFCLAVARAFESRDAALAGSTSRLHATVVAVVIAPAAWSFWIFCTQPESSWYAFAPKVLNESSTAFWQVRAALPRAGGGGGV